MTRDAYQVVQDYRSCAENLGTLHHHRKKLRIITDACTLESIAMDLLENLPKYLQGNQHLLVVTERYKKLPRKITLKHTTKIIVAQAFVYHLVMHYGTPETLLTD